MDTPRKLAAILAADIAGYSRLMGLDKSGRGGVPQALEMEATMRYGRLVTDD